MSFGLSSQGSWSSSDSNSDSSRSDTSSRRNGVRDEDEDLLNAVQEIQSPPRPSRIDYESYTALVRNIDKGDNLIAKKILAIRASAPEAQQDNTSGQSEAEGSTTRWPLQPGELGDTNEVEALEDSVLAFASSYIRQNRLHLPRQEGLRRSTDLDTTDLDELDERIPAFLPNIIDQVDSLLDNLATMRPEGSSRNRQQMRPMGWENVISAGLLGDIDTT